jgi:hypothetical protein
VGNIQIPNAEDRADILVYLEKLTGYRFETDEDGYLIKREKTSSSNYPKSNELVQNLIESKNLTKIKINNSQQGSSGGKGLVTLGSERENRHFWTEDPSGYAIIPEKACPAYVILAHELIHANNENDSEGKDIIYPLKAMLNKLPIDVKLRDKQGELNTVGIAGYSSAITENAIRAEHGEPKRLALDWDGHWDSPSLVEMHIDIPSNGWNYSFSGDKNCTISGSYSWLTVKNYNGSLDIKADPCGPQGRTASISITANDVYTYMPSRTIYLSQNGAAALDINLSNGILYPIVGSYPSDVVNPIAMAKRSTSQAAYIVARIESAPPGLTYDWSIPGSDLSGKTNQSLNEGTFVVIDIPRDAGKYTLTVTFSNGETLVRTVYVTCGNPLKTISKDGIHIHFFDKTFSSPNMTERDVLRALTTAVNSSAFYWHPESSAGIQSNDIYLSTLIMAERANCGFINGKFQLVANLFGINVNEEVCTADTWLAGKSESNNRGIMTSGDRFSVKTLDGTIVKKHFFPGSSPGHVYSIYGGWSFDACTGISASGKYGIIDAALKRVYDIHGAEIIDVWELCKAEDPEKLESKSPKQFLRKGLVHIGDYAIQYYYIDEDAYKDLRNRVSAPGSGASNSLAIEYGSATSNATWINIESATAPNGNYDTLILVVDPNTSPQLRSGTITVTNGDDTETITVNQDGTFTRIEPSVTSISHPTSGGEEMVNISSNVNWEASCDAEWLAIYSASGFGDGEMMIITDENTSDIARTATITISGGGESKTITVTQAVGATRLIVDPSTPITDISPSGDTRTITVNSNRSWLITSALPWVKLSQSEGTGNGSFSLEFAENTTNSPRSGIVTVKTVAGDVTRNIIVSQEKGIGIIIPSLTVSPTTITNISPSGGSTAITVASNTSWSATTTATWITLIPDSGSGDGGFTVEVAPNSTASSRSGIVTVKTTSGSGDLTRNIIVSQDKGSGPVIPILTLSQTAITNILDSGDSFPVIVVSNTTWSVTAKPDWVTISVDSDNAFTIIVDPNNTSTARSGVVTVKTTYGSGDKTSNIMVSQQKKATGF